MRKVILTGIGVLGIATMVNAGETMAPMGAEAYFISPKNGEVISGPVKVQMGLKGMGIAPAGIVKKDTGHHHLIINAATPDPSKPIPSDDNHRHFGGGQTETTLKLPPGTHTLQLVVGDHAHIPHKKPVVSERITITVK